jgi:hypothetical protein
LFGIVGKVLTMIELILVVWPSNGLVAISRLIAVVALLLGCLRLAVTTRLLFVKDAL